VPKKKKKNTHSQYEDFRFSSRGNTVKYYNQENELDEELGSMSESDEELKKKVPKVHVLDYDPGMDV
jgi:hypothetical protein